MQASRDFHAGLHSVLEICECYCYGSRQLVTVWIIIMFAAADHPLQYQRSVTILSFDVMRRRQNSTCIIMWGLAIIFRCSAVPGALVPCTRLVKWAWSGHVTCRCVFGFWLYLHCTGIQRQHFKPHQISLCQICLNMVYPNLVRSKANRNYIPSRLH